jgi:hypothetical protein
MITEGQSDESWPVFYLLLFLVVPILLCGYYPLQSMMNIPGTQLLLDDPTTFYD